MNQGTLIRCVCVLVVLVCMGASSVLAVRISSSSGRHQLVYETTVEDADPAEVSIGIAMGAFRGLFVNILWMRANELKEAGKYYEAVDLAKTITKLQPRFPRVWAFHAWNLAYNISVVTQTPEERWHWVNAGIALLRDEGIPKNPNDLFLHKELAWIFLHKVQGYLDDASRYYKRALATEWTVVLGAPPLRTADLQSRDAYIERLCANLDDIATAYDTLEELEAAIPETTELVERLDAIGLKPDLRLVEAVERRREGINLAMTLPEVGLDQADPLLALMGEQKFRAAGRALIEHIRKRALIDTYHMEPDLMIRYTRKYGPLDWRHPAAHSLYWAQRGVERAILRITPETEGDYDFTNTDRLVVQSIQELFRSGRVYYDITNPNFYLTLQDEDFIPTYGEILDEVASRSDYEDDLRAYSSLRAGYENFMKDAIMFLYRSGKVEQAVEYKRKLLFWDKANINEDEREFLLSLPIDKFVEHQIRDDERHTNPVTASGQINGALYSAFMDGLMTGDRDTFKRNYEFAREFHRIYTETQSFETAVNRQIADGMGEGRMEVVDRDFVVHAARVMCTLIISLSDPNSQVERGARMYRNAPADLQARAYRILADEGMYDIIKSRTPGASPEQATARFNRWFPPPEGMDAYLRLMERRRAEELERAKIESR